MIDVIPIFRNTVRTPAEFKQLMTIQLAIATLPLLFPINRTLHIFIVVSDLFRYSVRNNQASVYCYKDSRRNKF